MPDRSQVCPNLVGTAGEQIDFKQGPVAMLCKDAITGEDRPAVFERAL